eukprot:1160020-Pelagomonas_calceolata.AAC.3
MQRVAVAGGPLSPASLLCFLPLHHSAAAAQQQLGGRDDNSEGPREGSRKPSAAWLPLVLASPPKPPLPLSPVHRPAVLGQHARKQPAAASASPPVWPPFQPAAAAAAAAAAHSWRWSCCPPFVATTRQCLHQELGPHTGLCTGARCAVLHKKAIVRCSLAHKLLCFSVCAALPVLMTALNIHCMLLPTQHLLDWIPTMTWGFMVEECNGHMPPQPLLSLALPPKLAANPKLLVDNGMGCGVASFRRLAYAKLDLSPFALHRAADPTLLVGCGTGAADPTLLVGCGTGAADPTLLVGCGTAPFGRLARAKLGCALAPYFSDGPVIPAVPVHKTLPEAFHAGKGMGEEARRIRNMLARTNLF